MLARMAPTFFKSQAAFRTWLERNHDRKDELQVGFYKKASGKGGLTYKQAVDEGLCFGWIDGITRSLGDEAWTVRFTPRRPRSNWSRINVNRVGELRKAGLMHESGIAAFEGRDRSKDSSYSYENTLRKLSPALEKSFKANKEAWEFWKAQPPGYVRIASWWVMSAKRDETRERRLAKLIADSAAGRRTDATLPPSKKKTP